jgi:hypothetical protein
MWTFPHLFPPKVSLVLQVGFFLWISRILTTFPTYQSHLHFITVEVGDL